MASHAHQIPPDGRDFRELFQYVCDHGIGRPAGQDGVTEAWTDDALEAAFAETATPVDRRSIQSWRSGASVPRLDKVRSLAEVITSKSDERANWLKALIEARRNSLEARKSSAGTTASPETQPENETLAADASAPASRHWKPVVAGFLLLGLAVLGSLFLLTSESPDAQVANIEFCSEETFSTETYACTEAADSFSEDVTTLMVTFDLVNVPEGMSFERIWYREGLEFLRKSSFNDEAWPGYTFLKFDKFPEGNYTLRIIVDGKSFTKPFKVGDQTGYLAYQSD